MPKPSDPPPDFDFEAVREFLRCPKTHASFVYADGYLISRDAETRLAYPVTGGIPNLLVEDAEILSVEEWQRIVEDSETESTGSLGTPDSP